MLQLCPTGNSPLGETTSQCSSLMWSWAVGLGDFILPESAGFLVGNGTSEVSHVILEIHYDNPKHMSNVIDSSGFEVFYTNTLRQHNAAGMTMGDPTVSFSKMTTMTPYRLGNLPPGKRHFITKRLVHLNARKVCHATLPCLPVFCICTTLVTKC